MAYLLIFELIRKEEGLIKRFSEGTLRERLGRSIKNGLNRRTEIIKTDCVKILRELATRQLFYV